MFGPTNELTLEATVDRFQREIDVLNPIEVAPLPDLTSDINHNAKFVKAGAILLPGAYLDSGDDELSGIYCNDKKFWFQYQPANRLTREDSHNKVFFGSFWMLPQQTNDPETHVQVAVKSRELKHKELLAGETALFQQLGALGLKTFRPAGLIVGSEAVHLMTYFEGNVFTMDTVEWPEATLDEAWLELNKAVETMYQLHTNMLFHGDLEFRNIAFNQTGETVIVDPELMISAREEFIKLENAPMILDDEQKRSLDLLTRKMSHEFTAICKSIDSQIVPLIPKTDRPRKDEARLKLYRNHLFEPYKRLIQEANEPIRSTLLRVYDEMMIRKKAFAKEERL